jgi:hypothetical protein
MPASSEAVLDIARNLGELVLSPRGPAFDAFKDFGELFTFPGSNLTQSAAVV